MLFSSTVFLFLFLPVVLIVYYNPIIKNRKFKNYFLLLASIIFYAWGEPTFVLVMLASIILNWLFALLIDKNRDSKKGKVLLAIDVILNLSLLFVFKYLTFVLTKMNVIFNTNVIITDIVLPIGISFFTFQALSYVIDVYRNNGKVQKNPLNVALYVSLFPQLIAGPIVRYETVAEEINDRKENVKDFSSGVVRFIIGLSKKVLIANTMGLIADEAFSILGSDLSVGMSWLGLIAYSFQIFFDFSGYSDMAIGLGKMFGFHFLENFNYPYISKSISEFWRRWHISLGTWFRDYVYFPLGGSRVKTKARLVFNLFVVWFCTGIWHGANYTFAAWGLLYFLLIAFEKLTGIDKKLKGFGHVYTLFFVLIGWLIFRSDSLSGAYIYLKSMFGVNKNLIVDNTFLLNLWLYKYHFIAAILFSMPLKSIIEKKINLNNKVFSLIYVIVIILLFLVSIAFILSSSYNPFIYFNF